MRTLLIALLYIFRCFCLTILVAIVSQLVLKVDKDTNALIMMLVFFLSIGVGALRLMKPRKEKRKRLETEWKEREMLKVISEKGGKITPLEVAAEIQLNIDEAKIELDKLCEKGVGELQIAEIGHPVYVFFGPAFEEN